MLITLLLLELSSQGVDGHALTIPGQDLVESAGLVASPALSRQRYVVVNQPAAGFFIHGSNIDRLNGIYGRVSNSLPELQSTPELSYRHDQTGWLLVLVCPDGGNNPDGGGNEWLIVDPQGHNRFRHAGGTWFPGSGTRWEELEFTHTNFQTKTPIREVGRCAISDGSSSDCPHLGGGDAGYSWEVCVEAMERLDGNTINFRNPGACYIKKCAGDDLRISQEFGEWEVYSTLCTQSHSTGSPFPQITHNEYDRELQKSDEDKHESLETAMVQESVGRNLPWQVVPLLDQGMLMTVRAHFEFRTHNIWKATRGDDLAFPEIDSLESRWREGCRLFQVAAPSGARTLEAPRIDARLSCGAPTNSTCVKCRPGSHPEGSKCDLCLQRACACSISPDSGRCSIDCPPESGCRMLCEKSAEFYSDDDCGLRRFRSFVRGERIKDEWVFIQDESGEGWIQIVSASGRVHLVAIREEDTPVASGVVGKMQKPFAWGFQPRTSDLEQGMDEEPSIFEGKNESLTSSSVDADADSLPDLVSGVINTTQKYDLSRSDGERLPINMSVCSWCRRCLCSRTGTLTSRTTKHPQQTYVAGSSVMDERFDGQSTRYMESRQTLIDIRIGLHTALLEGTFGKHAALVVRKAVGLASMHEQLAGLRMLETLLIEQHNDTLALEIELLRIFPEDLVALQLRLHFALVVGLLNNRREVLALEKAQAAVKEYPMSISMMFLFARCLLRLGRRREGLEALFKAANLSTTKGIDFNWGSKQVLLALNSLQKVHVQKLLGDEHYLKGQFSIGAEYYGEAIRLSAYEGFDDKRGRFILHVNRASCFRRQRDFEQAVNEFDSALEFFPHDLSVLHRKGSTLLEKGSGLEAKIAFEQILRRDRHWENLDEWLFRAHRLLRPTKPSSKSRAKDAPQDNVDLYMLLGVSTQSTPEELKHAYRMASLKVHPDKEGGNVLMFRRLTEAYKTLSDPEMRRKYDEGHRTSSTDGGSSDALLEHSLKEEVERKYFPERFEFWPFGNPFVGRHG